MAKGRYWTWLEPLYGVELNLFTGPHEAFTAYLQKRKINVKDASDQVPAGKVIEHWADDGRRHYFIWIAQKFDIGSPSDLNTLVHECTHVTMTALMRRGVNADATHEEPYCYFMGWLFEQCYSRLKGHRR